MELAGWALKPSNNGFLHLYRYARLCRRPRRRNPTHRRIFAAAQRQIDRSTAARRQATVEIAITRASSRTSDGDTGRGIRMASSTTSQLIADSC